MCVVFGGWRARTGQPACSLSVVNNECPGLPGGSMTTTMNNTLGCEDVGYLLHFSELYSTVQYSQTEGINRGSRESALARMPPQPVPMVISRWAPSASGLGPWWDQ